MCINHVACVKKLLAIIQQSSYWASFSICQLPTATVQDRQEYWLVHIAMHSTCAKNATLAPCTQLFPALSVSVPLCMQTCLCAWFLPLATLHADMTWLMSQW